MAAKKNGRPTKYNEKLRDEICHRLALGESLRSICRDKSMPTLSTVMLWVVQDRENFSVHYARARDAQAITHVDEMLDYRHGLLSGEIEPQAAKVAADIIKWTSERMARRRFGKSDLPEEKGDKPITINIVDAVKQANDSD